MSDSMLNLNNLIRENATLEAKKQLLQNIGQIKKFFNEYDPYIQAILIQSVINISEDEFSKIASEYHELIDMAKQSSNEWVKRKADEFSDFPKIKIDEDIHNDFDISPLEELLLGSTEGNFNSEEQDVDSVEELEKLDHHLQPPHSYLKPPVPIRKSEHNSQSKATTENLLSIPSAPRVQRPPNQQPHRPNEIPNRPNYQPQTKKKEKKILSELPDFMLFNSKKKK